MITNQPTEEEVFLKKKQEQAWIDSILDKAFPEGKKDNKNPYLKYEDLLDNPKQKIGDLTGMAVPIQEGKAVYEKRLTPNEEIDAKKDWSEEKKSQKKAEIAKIQEVHDAIEKEINREHILEQAKNYGGAALEIGSAAVPGYGGAKLAGTVAKKLAPKVGRKIANEIASGTLKGASSGTVAGLGRGLLEDENPLKTAMQDTITGATLGAGFGTVGANAQKAVRGNELRKQVDLKKARSEAVEYYDDYLLGTKVRRNKNEIMDFSNSGIKKTKNTSADIRKLQAVPDLPKLIKQGELEGSLLPHKDNAKFEKYHYIKNDNYNINGKSFPNRIIIGEDANGKHFYNLNELSYPSALQNKNSVLLPNEQILGKTESNNIIPPSQVNLNPGQQPVQKPMLYEEWLEELKRRRKKGWW